MSNRLTEVEVAMAWWGPLFRISPFRFRIIGGHEVYPKKACLGQNLQMFHKASRPRFAIGSDGKCYLWAGPEWLANHDTLRDVASPLEVFRKIWKLTKQVESVETIPPDVSELWDLTRVLWIVNTKNRTLHAGNPNYRLDVEHRAIWPFAHEILDGKLDEDHLKEVLTIPIADQLPRGLEG